MAKKDDASTSDQGTPAVTYVRVGRGMVKVTKYEKQDKDKHEGSIHSFDSSQPVRAPSVKSGSSHNRTMPSWVPKFKKKKSKKNLGEVDKHDSLAPPVPAMPTPPLSPDARPLRAVHSHNDLTQATPTDMWQSITQLESELVARYGRGAVPQFEALRDRMQQVPQPDQPRQEPQQEPRQEPRTRTETLPSSRPARTFVGDLEVYPQLQPVEPEEPEDDSDDGAAYLEALGIEAPEKPKPKFEQKPRDTIRQPHHRSATMPPEYSQALGHPSPEMLEHYATTRRLPRSDYVTTQLGLTVDTPRSVSPYTPPSVDTVPESPQTPGRRRHLPPRPSPPSTYPPHAPTPPLNVSRSGQSSPALRPQASLTVPSPHTPRSPQLSLPLVRVRITSPPNRGALRALPALVLLTPQAKATFAAATWAQMVTYCARNAGVSIARRGGGGNLLISIEERMAEVVSPGGGRGVGDEEVGFGLGYYVSVEMNLEEDGLGEGGGGESVPVARLEIPLPTTLGEIASVFRERKDIRKALS